MTLRNPWIDGIAIAVVVVGAAVAVRLQPKDVDQPVVAAESVVLARNQPGRLALADGSLYWTSGATAYRTALDGRPGTEQIIGRARPGTTFGAIAPGHSPYVVVNQPRRKASWISRPGAAAVVAESPGWIGRRDLITDGQSLFWADAGGVRAVSLRGGPVRTLATTTSAGELGTGAGRVYFADGTTIRSVTTSGSSLRLEIAAAHLVVSLSVRAAVIAWAESDGSVKQRSGVARPLEYAAPVARRQITDVTVDGRRLLWAYCDDRCRLAQHLDGVTAVVDLDGPARDLAVDGTATALICEGQLQRHALPPPRPGLRRGVTS